MGTNCRDLPIENYFLSFLFSFLKKVVFMMVSPIGVFDVIHVDFYLILEAKVWGCIGVILRMKS